MLRKVWFDLNEATGKKPLAGRIMADRVLCYRALAATAAEAAGNASYARLLWWWRRSLPIRTDEDRKEFLPAMADIYAAEVLAYPAIRDIH